MWLFIIASDHHRSQIDRSRRLHVQGQIEDIFGDSEQFCGYDRVESVRIDGISENEWIHGPAVELPATEVDY